MFVTVAKGKEKVDLEAVHKSEQQREENKVLQLLKMFDKDGDGFLSVDEWKNVLNRMGMKASTKEANVLFQNVDTNGDGKIDLDEFMKYIAK